MTAFGTVVGPFDLFSGGVVFDTIPAPAHSMGHLRHASYGTVHAAINPLAALTIVVSGRVSTPWGPHPGHYGPVHAYLDKFPSWPFDPTVTSIRSTGHLPHVGHSITEPNNNIQPLGPKWALSV